MEVGKKRVISKLDGSKENLEHEMNVRREKIPNKRMSFENFFSKKKTISTHNFCQISRFFQPITTVSIMSHDVEIGQEK